MKKVTLDLSRLEIKKSNELFFGIHTISLKQKAIAVQCRKNKAATSFARTDDQDWFTPVRAFPIELKFDLEFSQR